MAEVTWTGAGGTATRDSRERSTDMRAEAQTSGGCAAAGGGDEGWTGAKRPGEAWVGAGVGT